jgi:predicted homoserine dehydrogenase-like protein
MILVDTALKKRAEQGRPVKVALIGAGAIGRGVANQIINSTPGMQLAVIASRTIASAQRAYSENGVKEFKEVSTVTALNDCIARNIPAVTEDAFMVCEAEGIEVLIEVVGLVEFGAKFALKAFACGKNLLSMNAEMDGTFGLALRRRAEKAGVIYTLADGDQPGLEINLVRQVKFLGLEPLVCGNIKGLQDCRRNPTTQEGFAKKWNQGVNMVTSFADGTKISLEQACVANATGMVVEQRGMRGGDFEGHVDELCHNGRYDVDKLRALGGVVDYVVKSKPAPGVFVLATHDDPKQRRGLELYKMGPGPLYSFYIPYHLCYFEVPLSAARVALFRDTILAAKTVKVDVITVAKTALKAGTVLDAIGGYHTYGTCENHPIVRRDNLLPMGLAEGCKLKRDVPVDHALTYDDVEVPPGRLCDQLRAEQDSLVTV